MRYLVAALLLASCAKPSLPPPAVEVRYQTVVKEVAKPCPVTVPTRPAPLAKPLPADAISLAAVLGLKLAEYAAPGGYGERADAALRKCVAP